MYCILCALGLESSESDILYNILLFLLLLLLFVTVCGYNIFKWLFLFRRWKWFPIIILFSDHIFIFFNEKVTEKKIERKKRKEENGFDAYQWFCYLRCIQNSDKCLCYRLCRLFPISLIDFAFNFSVQLMANFQLMTWLDWCVTNLQYLNVCFVGRLIKWLKFHSN